MRLLLTIFLDQGSILFQKKAQLTYRKITSLNLTEKVKRLFEQINLMPVL